MAIHVFAVVAIIIIVIKATIFDFMMKTIHSLVLPAREGVVRAVHRATVSQATRKHNEHKSGREGSSALWKSFWTRVSTRRTIAISSWVGANGAMLVRAASNATSESRANMAKSSKQTPRVCILGGGFGGLYTAIKLESFLWPRGTKPQVTLVDQAERFTFKPLLYELITGAATATEVAPTYASVLEPYDVNFIRGRVAEVIPDKANSDSHVSNGVDKQKDSGVAALASDCGGTVLLTSGERLPYDWLILALGSETNSFGVPGVEEYALPFSNFDDASRVVSQLDEVSSLTSYPEIVVVGGGYASVELAAAVAERLEGRGRVQLVTKAPEILQGCPAGQRDAARRALEDEGVSILVDAAVSEIRLAGTGGAKAIESDVNIDESADGSLHGRKDPLGTKRLVMAKRRPVTAGAGSESKRSATMEILEADIVLWAAGQTPVPRIESSSLKIPFATDSSGALQTDKTLRVLNHRRVFALGDVSVLGHEQRNGGTERLPATAQVAFQQADYVAWNIWASINSRPLLNFKYQHLGSMMSLGSSKGAIALPIAIPPPLSAIAQTGPLGEVLRAAGVRVTTSFAGASDGVTIEGPLGALLRRAAYLYRQPTDQQRIRAAGSWLELAGKQAIELTSKLAGDGYVRTRKEKNSF